MDPLQRGVGTSGNAAGTLLPRLQEKVGSACTSESFDQVVRRLRVIVGEGTINNHFFHVFL